MDVCWCSCRNALHRKLGDQGRGFDHQQCLVITVVVCCAQTTWQQHLDTLPAANIACVVVKAKGKPFSEYNGMAAQELQ